MILVDRAPFADVSKSGYYIETQQLSSSLHGHGFSFFPPRVGPQELAYTCALQNLLQGLSLDITTFVLSRVSLSCHNAQNTGEKGTLWVCTTQVSLVKEMMKAQKLLSISAHVPTTTDCEGHSRTLAATERSHEVPGGLACHRVNGGTWYRSHSPSPLSLQHPPLSLKTL